MWRFIKDYTTIMRNKHGFTLKLFQFIFVWKHYHSFITYIKQQSINTAVWFSVPKQTFSMSNLLGHKMIHINVYLHELYIPQNKENKQFSVAIPRSLEKKMNYYIITTMS